ncbi:MAG: hypothetical protein ACYC1M_08535 [Armatimonadota bacterium]
MHLRTLLLCGLMLAGMSLGAQAAKEANPIYTKGRVSARDFVIMPWGGMPELNKTGSFWPNAFWDGVPKMDAAMKDLWECGFNTTGFASLDTVKFARKYGLSVIATGSPITDTMSDAEAQAAAAKFLAPYKDDPALLGIYIKDEPNTSAFPMLAKAAKAILTADKEKLPYINLLPNYATNEQLGADSYGEYIDKFVQQGRPSFLSYDNYSLFEGRGLDADRYYSNLEVMRAKALQYQLPFWNIVLGTAHFEYAEPSQATIYLQMYTSLAYGVKGLAYFTYYTPPIGSYRLAAIDQFGRKTQTWEYIRMANMQLHRLAPSYLKLKSVNVFHTPNIPLGCRGLDSSKYLKAIEGKDLLVGEFVGPDRTPYIMVVNKSLTNSTYFNPTFNDKGTVMSVNAYRGIDIEFSGENRFLAPGHGMLLYLKK